MEFEFRLTKKDYLKFNRLYIKDLFKRQFGLLFLFVLLVIVALSGQSHIWWRILLAIITSPIIVLSFFGFVPLLISFIHLNRILSKDKSPLEEKKLTVLDEGLKIQSESKTSILNWAGMKAISFNSEFIYITRIDKKVLPIPQRCFPSETEAINFLGLLQSKIFQTKGITKFQTSNDRAKPNYRLGFICLIPLVGAVAGLIFILDGISKYKDKWFVLMGFAGIVFTLSLAYFSFYHFGIEKEFRKGFAVNSQMQLNSLMKYVEFYKIKHGDYPDSLEQVRKEDPMVWIDDPIQFEGNRNNTKFNYRKVGTHYYLFSSGIDGIPNTKDDIYPQVAKSDSSKFGLIRK